MRPRIGQGTDPVDSAPESGVSKRLQPGQKCTKGVGFLGVLRTVAKLAIAPWEEIG